MAISIDDNLVAFWYIEWRESGLDWRMGLVRLRGGVPQLVSRVRNYGDPGHTGYIKNANPYLWTYTTGSPGDSISVGLNTGRDWAKEMSRRWRQPVFEAARRPFEPTEQLAHRIQRDLFFPSLPAPGIDYNASIRRRHVPISMETRRIFSPP